jgi:hypothetical protein
MAIVVQVGFNRIPKMYENSPFKINSAKEFANTAFRVRFK